MSFLDLVLDYNKLINNGYNKTFLNQSLHSMLSLPFFCFNDCNSSNINYEYFKKSDNFKFIILG